MRKRYFTKHLDWAVRSEFERTKTQDYMQSRTLSLQQPPGHVADARRAHDTSSLRPVIRRVDTDPRPIPHTDFGGMLLQRALSHTGPVMRPDERDNRHDILHESPITSAVSVQQTRAEQDLHSR